MLQWLALLSMVADHADKLLGIGSPVLLSFGRFAFPVFAFLVARNVGRSSDPGAYVHRMIFWGLVAQPVFMFAFDTLRLNVLFSLALIALACLALQKDKRLLLVGAVGAAAFCDYGILGCLFGLACFVALRSPDWRWWLTPALLAVGFTPLRWAWVVVLAVECCALSTVPAGALLDRRPVSSWARRFVSRFFYAFYPAHLAVLLLTAVAVAS